MPDPLTRFRVFCQPQSPLVLGARRGARNVIASLDYIPGPTFRGALAAIYPDLAGTPLAGPDLAGPPLASALDWSLFRSGVSFPDLTPEGSVPIPRSALSCKRARGFLRGTDEHGVYDLLLFPRPASLQCHVCDADLKPLSGWMLDRGRPATPELTRAATLHTAIHPATRTADAGLFYLEQSIYSGQGFAGDVVATAERKDRVRDLLASARKNGLRLGHGRSKGLGRAGIDFEETPEDRVPPVAARIHGLQERLRLAADHSQDAAFTVTLRSRAVLLDDYLRFRSRLSIADLIEAGLGDPDFNALLGGFQLKSWYTGREPVFGWNATAQLPKSADLATVAGACFLFGRRKRPLTTAEATTLAAGFSAIEERGIGERIAEGFGRVVVCDPFHWKEDTHVRVGEHYILH